MKHPITLIIVLLLALRATLHAADTFDHATIVGLMRQTNDWQTAHPRMQPDDRNWERGTWFTGIMAAHKATGDEKYLTQALDWGRQHRWQVGREISGANKLFCSMTWLELFLLKRDEAMIQPTVNWLATDAPNSPGGAEVWFRHQPNHSDSPLYSDSLYAMPALAMLHQATGETKYLDILHHFSTAVTDELLDPQDEYPGIEPRRDWPRESPCAEPQVDLDGKPGAPVIIEIDCHEGRRHLPIIRARRAA